MQNHLSRLGILAFFWLAVLSVGSLSAQTTWYDKARAETDNNRQVEYFTKSLELERNDGWVYYFRGWAYYRLGRYEKASRDFKAGLTANGNLDPTFLNASLAWCSYRLERYEEGLKFAETAIEQRKDNSEGWNVKGWCHIQLDQAAEAAKAFTQFIALQPDQPSGYTSRSYAYLMAKEYNNVISDCDKGLAIDPTNENLLERKAFTLIKMGKKEEGIELIRTKINYKPDDPLSLSHLGDLFYKNEDYATAIEYHTSGMRMYEAKMREDREFMNKHRVDIYEIYMSRGNVYYAMEDNQRALGDYKHATSILPTDYRAWQEIGHLQTFQKNWFEGAQAYEKAFSIRPDLKTGWVNLGFCYDNLNQPTRAIDAYTRGIKNNPDVGLLYNNRGYGYLELKQYDLALADLEKAIEVEPEIVMSHVSLGEYYFDRKMFNDAIAKFNTAIKMEDGTSEAYTAAYYTRGMCYFELEQFDKAISDFLKTIEWTPKHVLAHEMAGITYYKLNKLCDSYTFLKRTLALESNVANKKAKQAPLYLGKMTTNPCNK